MESLEQLKARKFVGQKAAGNRKEPNGGREDVSRASVMYERIFSRS